MQYQMFKLRAMKYIATLPYIGNKAKAAQIEKLMKAKEMSLDSLLPVLVHKLNALAFCNVRMLAVHSYLNPAEKELYQINCNDLDWK